MTQPDNDTADKTELVAEAGLDETPAEAVTTDETADPAAGAGDDEALDRLLSEYGVPSEMPAHEDEQPESTSETNSAEPDVMHLDNDAFRKLQKTYGYITN